MQRNSKFYSLKNLSQLIKEKEPLKSLATSEAGITFPSHNYSDKN